MSYTDPEPRPEPVLDEAKTAAKVTSLLTAVLTVATVLGYTTAGEASGIAAAGLGAAGAVITIVNYLVPIARARKARDKVTPLADPRSADGLTLVPGVLLPPPGPF